MILVDSSVWIDYFRGHAAPQTNRLDALLGSRPLATGDLMLAEVLQGFDAQPESNQAKKLLTSLVMIDLVGRQVALQAAKNFRKLRARGITVRKTIDAIIATHCILHSHELLYTDRDFDVFVKHLGLRSAMQSQSSASSAARPNQVADSQRARINELTRINQISLKYDDAEQQITIGFHRKHRGQIASVEPIPMSSAQITSPLRLCTLCVFASNEFGIPSPVVGRASPDPARPSTPY